MARTAPFPNFPAIPGMNPGVFVLGGGSDNGGSGPGGGKGKGGGGGGNGNNGGKDADGGGKSANGNNPCGGGCGGPHSRASRGDPVDVLSGRVATVPVIDFVLPGPLPLSFARSYDSGARERDTGLGWGWSHPLAWEIELHRRALIIWDEEGSRLVFPPLGDGAEALGPRGWVLRRHGQRYELDTGDDLRRTFEALPEAELAVLREVRDPNGNTLTVERAGRALHAFHDSAGRVVEVERSEDGRIHALNAVLPTEGHRRARLISYHHDDHGDLVRVADADGYESSFTYDGDHRLTGATNRCGVTFHYAYDARGRCVETWGDFAASPDSSLKRPQALADGITRTKGAHHYRFDYAEDGYTEVAGGAAVERFMGSPGGRIDQSVHGGMVVSRQYDEAGHLIAFSDGLGATTTIARDTRGRRLRTVDPLGRVTSCTRDAAGRIVEEVDPAGSVTRTAYDARGNVLQTVAPDGAVTSHTYDARGLMLTWTEPNGATSHASYDEAGNWIALTLPNGGTWRRTFDGLGRKLSESDPAGGTKHFQYSLRGDLRRVQDEAGGVTTTTHDGEHHVTSETDPIGARTTYEYGAHGKLHRFVAPTGSLFEIYYTLDASIAEAVNQAGEHYTLSWDSRGNLIEERSFDGRVIASHYDLANRLVRSVQEPSGTVALLTYDAAGQLLRRELSDGEVEDYEYDAAGRVLSAKNSATLCTFERDVEGRIVREEQRIGQAAVTLETTYAPTGESITRRSSLGHDERMIWSAGGALTGREVNGVPVLRAVLDSLERQCVRGLPGGGSIQTAYDVTRRLAGSRVLAREEVTAERRLQCAADGAPANVWDSRRGGTRYERDAAGRLVAEVRERGPAWAFAFDAAGNLHEREEPRTYGAGGRLLALGETTFHYDGEGRLVEKAQAGAAGSWHYEWADTGRLRSVVTPLGERVDFVYDCFGRRLLKRTRAGEIRFVWNGDELLHEVRSAAPRAPEVRTYLFEPGTWAPVAHRDGRPSTPDVCAAWVHYVTDALASPVLLVDDGGRVVAEVERSPWGLPLGRLPTPIGLPGQYLDEETGLAYHRFRYYDPRTGRFLSPDPLGLEGGADLYGYPPDPTRWDDPLGLRFPDWIRQDALDDNRTKNGGTVQCSNSDCGVTCLQPQKSTKGDTMDKRPSMAREWQLDHIDPKSKGGSDLRDNCQVLCRRCNREKSNK